MRFDPQAIWADTGSQSTRIPIEASIMSCPSQDYTTTSWWNKIRTAPPLALSFPALKDGACRAFLVIVAERAGMPAELAATALQERATPGNK
jgi:hypothetical protein